MKVPTLTIAIPAFERTDYIEAAIISVFNQTVPADEIIIVDNGSSHSEIQKIVEKYPGAQYRKHHKNIGMFANWNSCAAISTQDYFMILGDDDLLDRTFVEKVKGAIQSANQPDIVFTDYEPFATSDSLDLWKPSMFFGDMSGTCIRRHSARHGLFFPTISCAIRKSSFNPFYSEVHGSNDWLWSISLADDVKIHGISEKLVRYRKHGGGDSETGMWVNIFTHMCIYWYLHDRLLKAHPVLSILAGLRASKCAALLFHSGEAARVKALFQSTPNLYVHLCKDFENSIFGSLFAPVLACGLAVRGFFRRIV